MQGSDWREPDKVVLRQELRTRGVNSHLDRSPGSIPTGWERPRFHPNISLWKPYLPFSHRLQYFRSHRMRRRRKRRDLQAHPRGSPPRRTHQPCPGRGQMRSDPSAPPTRARSSGCLPGTGTSSCTSGNWQRWHTSYSNRAL